MTWIELEEQWLRDGRHVYFAPEDDAAIDAFQRHLRRRRLGFVVHTRPDVPAVVFTRPPRRTRRAPAEPGQRAA